MDANEETSPGRRRERERDAEVSLMRTELWRHRDRLHALEQEVEEIKAEQEAIDKKLQAFAGSLGGLTEP